MDSKIFTFKGFTFKVTAVFGHHVAVICIAVCLSHGTVLWYSHTIRQACDGLCLLWVQAGTGSDFEPWLMTELVITCNSSGGMIGEVKFFKES